MIMIVKLLQSSTKSARAAKVEWKVVSTASGLLTGLIVRKVLGWAWGRFAPSEHEPPLNPADRRVGWGESVAWAVAAGVGVGVGRLVSDRVAAAGWELATGEPPPGIRPR